MKLAATSHRRKRGRIEIIPLIDIVFFLLATFVMVSLSMKKHHGMAINLPESQSADKSGSVEEQISISVLKSGDVFLNREAMNTETLVERLKVIFVNAPQSLIALEGDEEAPLGRFVNVLDNLRQIGFTNIAIRTEAKSSELQSNNFNPESVFNPKTLGANNS